MLPKIDPERLVEVIERRAESEGGPVLVFWYCVDGPREAYSKKVIEAVSATAIVPLIPRKAGMFEAPNALISDLVELINDNQQSFDAIAERGFTPQSKLLVILILSRSPLMIPGGCSPAQLPDWFPRVGGINIDVPIEDLTFSADGPLNASEASVPALCESLYDVELALLERLNAALQSRPDKIREFLLLILDSKEDPAKADLADFISDWEASAKLVTERRGFRPAVAKGNGIVARLIRLCGTTTPVHLQKVGKAIGEVLSCSSKTEGSIVAVLYRSTWPETNDHSRFSRNLLVTLYATYQYVTASAHSDQYPRFPIPLMHSISKHLISELDRLSAVLRTDL